MKKKSKSDFLINKNKIIFIDGLIGGGKSLIANITGSIQGVDWWRYESKFEQLCSLNYFKKIDLEDASSLIVKFYNEIYYANFILRHVNFRNKDISSVYKHPRSEKILKRLNLTDNSSKTKYKKSKIIIPFMTHFNSMSSEPLFKSFGEKLVYLYLTKSPYDYQIINHLAKWTKEWEKKKNRFAIFTSFDKKSKKFYPKFVEGYKNEYLKINRFEKAILILKIFSDYKKNIKKINFYKNKYNSKIIIIPFEGFIINPDKYVNSLLKLLGKTTDKILKLSLKKNDVPRKSNFLKRQRIKYHDKKFNDDKVSEYLKNKVSKKYLFELYRQKKNYDNFVKKFNDF